MLPGCHKAKNEHKNRQSTRQRMMRKIFSVKSFEFEVEVEERNFELMGPTRGQCWVMGSYIGQ